MLLARAVLAHEGHREEVRRLAQEARQCFVARTVFYRADIYVTLAEALREVGDTAAAREQAREALRIYEQKGHVVGAANARALLG